MSVVDSPNNSLTAIESTDVILRRISRALDYAEGFWLGFAKCNVYLQKQRAIKKCNQLLDPLNVHLIEIDLREPVAELLPILKEQMVAVKTDIDAFTRQRADPFGEEFSYVEPLKIALSISGLERSITSLDAYPPILSYLNLNREIFRQELSVPILIWLPDYALTSLARHAPDFWAWRSGLYEFAPEPLIVEQAFKPLRRESVAAATNLPAPAKREKLTILKGLLADYVELGGGRHELNVQLKLSLKISSVHQDLYEWPEAKQSLMSSLKIAQELGEQHLIIGVLNQQGRLAVAMGFHAEAEELFQEAIDISREDGSSSDLSYSLNQLGKLKQFKGDYQKAKELYEESLVIRREENNYLGIAYTLNQLGRAEQKQGNYLTARKFYSESLKISNDLKNEVGIGFSLFNLGVLAQEMRDFELARKLLNDCLKMRLENGDNLSVAVTLSQIGLIAQELGDYVEARRHYENGLEIRRELGDLKGEAFTLRQLSYVDEIEGREEDKVNHRRLMFEIYEKLSLRRKSKSS